MSGRTEPGAASDAVPLGTALSVKPRPTRSPVGSVLGYRLGALIRRVKQFCAVSVGDEGVVRRTRRTEPADCPAWAALGARSAATVGLWRQKGQ